MEEELEVVKIEKREYEDSTKRLGTQATADVSYKKILLRKYNASLKRL